MGSTGESDRKRRHFNSLSPMAATAKKQPVLPISEDKKVWFLCLYLLICFVLSLNWRFRIRIIGICSFVD